MRQMHLNVVALTSVLFASGAWSCSDHKTLTEPAETRSAQEQLSSATMPSTRVGMMDQLRAGCPMVVPGADVAVIDTEGGVALTFTADSDKVADLRTGVEHMAQMYEMHRERAGMMWHRMGGEGMARGGPGMGMGRMAGHGSMAGRGPMPAASTTLTDSDLGTRLEFRPTDPSQLDSLREHVRWHQQRMHAGECWMLQDQPTKTPPQEQE